MSSAYNDRELTALANIVATGGDLAKFVDKFGRTTSALTKFICIANAGETHNEFKKSHRRFLNLLEDAKVKAQTPAVRQNLPTTNGSAPIAHRQPWTDTQDAMLLKKFCTNVHPEVIAAEMNRTIISILGRLHALGVLSFDKEQGGYYTKTPYYRVVNPDLQ